MKALKEIGGRTVDDNLENIKKELLPIKEFVIISKTPGIKRR